MKKKLGKLEDRLGLGNGKTLFKNQAAFADFLGTSRKTVSTNIKNGNIVLTRQGKISFVTKENTDYAAKYFKKAGFKQYEIDRVIFGEKDLKISKELKHIEVKNKEKQAKYDQSKPFPEDLKEFLDPNVEPDYSKLNPDQIKYITELRKLQKATIEVRQKDYDFKLSKGENVSFEDMKGVFNAIIEILALQLRSGVGRGFGKKIKIEFDTLVARDASNVDIVGALDKFHGDFSDKLLDNTMEEIKKLLEKNKLT